MKSRHLLATFAALLLSGAFVRAKTLADLVPPAKRATTVETAQRLAKVTEVAPLPDDMPQPFAPPNFDQPDPEEVRAASAALARAAQAPRPTAAGGGGEAPGQPPRAMGDREVLEAMGPKIPSQGTIVLNGTTWLILPTLRVHVGNKFTVSFKGQDYDLELTAIDNTTFTLRLNNEEFTRPIKSGK